MHARILRYLDEVVRSGSIRAASEKLHVAPSAISRQIKTLEEQVGAPIFHRGARDMTLTAAGELLMVHVRETLREESRTLAQIEDLKGLRRGEVSLAIMSGLAGNVIPRSLAAFRKANPRVSMKVQLLPTGEAIMEAVASGDADFGIGFDFPERFGLRIHVTSLAQLGAVMAAGHPLAARSSLRLSDCIAYPLILADASMVIRPYLDRALAPLRGSPEILAETNSIEVMRVMAAGSDGISFLTRFDIEREAAAGTLVLVPIQEFADRTQKLMVVGSERYANAMANVYLETLKPMLAGK
ncbi:LysR family transcriptional regulator [Mangrovicoccus ximenensis]|uniref:LysR family transcriptional regulator n=1 Tax=Mangrovicoccus ximenensis TaxID=1911570 RepID=UPI000D384C99|nr:LysR family transcriptional regulator [Mangrovicoccus ximenensis]